MGKPYNIGYRMGINLPIILYTHTDMKDIWSMSFGQTKKYLSDFKIYVAVNRDDETIPVEYSRLLYDDTVTYTERWKSILNQVQEDIILFLHEDMIMLGAPNVDLLETYAKLIESNTIRSVKLLFAGDKSIPSYIHPTLVSNELARFSIQPTILTKQTFNDILDGVGKQNIWNFETAVSRHFGDFMSYIGTERKRGMFHYDSNVFPYIATAINKGKWNYTEYKPELDVLFSEYSIDPNIRGIV